MNSIRSCPRALALAGLPVLGLLGACEVTPDPCASYSLACIAVTVQSGPPNVHQLQVQVEDYGSVTSLTPRQAGDNPLTYPLRFAVKFIQEFDGFHRGQVVLDVVALARDNSPLAEVRQTVPITGIEKVRLPLQLGPLLDLAAPADLRPAPDLSAPDLAQPDLADGGPGN